MLKNYLIESQILFLADDNRLVRLSDGEFVELSLTASRLLLLMMTNHGQVVSRETIFTEIFDRYGAQSTGNNLNQYIRNLRKQFIFLGWESEIIRTVPRIGFTVTNSVSIETQQRCVDYVKNTTEHMPTDQSQLSVLTALRSRNLASLWIVMMLIIISACCFMHFAGHRSSFSWFSLANVQPHKVIRDDGCEYFQIASGTLMSSLLIADPHSLVLPKLDSLCGKKSTFRHYVMQSGGGLEKTRTFILSCSGEAGQESACISHYESREH